VVIVAVVVVVGRGSWVACVVVQYKIEGEQSIFKPAGPLGPCVRAAKSIHLAAEADVRLLLCQEQIHFCAWG
jgi:hypothetical protein